MGVERQRVGSGRRSLVIIAALVFGAALFSSACVTAPMPGDPGDDDTEYEDEGENGESDFALDLTVDGPEVGWIDSCEPTSGDAQGPYHVEGAPVRDVLVDEDTPGERLVIEGFVLGEDCETPLPNAELDLWHADASGQYAMGEGDWTCRGRVRADEGGFYAFETVMPAQYENRPKHIHVIVTASDHRDLATQIYFAGDPFLGPNDGCQPPTCNSYDEARQVEIEWDDTGEYAAWIGALDIVLAAI